MRRPSLRVAVWSLAAAAVSCIGVVTAQGATPTTFDSRIATTTGGEPAIAVDRTDTQTLVTTITDRTLQLHAPEVGIVVSHDRGVTWKRADLSLTVTSDPFVVSDAEGRFYAGAVGTHPGTSGAVLNTVLVTTSTDHGETWSTPVEALGPDAIVDPTSPDGPVDRGPSWTSVDRPFLAVDGNTSDVYATAVDHSDNAGGESEHLAVPWELNFAACRSAADGYPTFACGRRYVSVSRDHGATWSPPQPMDTQDYPGDFTAGFSGMPTAAHGVLATAYIASRADDETCHPCVVFETSTDGGAHWIQRPAPGIAVSTGGVEDPTGNMAADPVQPYVAADPSRASRYAVAVPDNTGSKLLVYLTSDSGLSWSGPATLAEPDRPLLERPWMAYSPTGALGIMYRADFGNGSYDVWAVVAPRGDLRFAPAQRLSSAVSPPPNTHSAIDDVSSAVMDGQYLHAAWGDVRDGAIHPWYGRLRYHGG